MLWLYCCKLPATSLKATESNTIGIKVINLHTNEIALLLGKNETIRFMNLALYQGAPKRKTLVTVEMAASDNTVIKESEETDPTIFVTSFKKNRFYQFTRREPDTSLTAMSRDVFNEKPTREEQAVNVSTIKKVVGQQCIIHTTFGDIYLRLFPEIAPRACENFMQHAKDRTKKLTRLLRQHYLAQMYQRIHDPRRRSRRRWYGW